MSAAGLNPGADEEAEAVPPFEARATLTELPPPGALTVCESVVLVEVALAASPA